MLDGLSNGYLGQTLSLLDIESQVIDENNPFYTAGFITGMAAQMVITTVASGGCANLARIITILD